MTDSDTDEFEGLSLDQLKQQRDQLLQQKEAVRVRDLAAADPDTLSLTDAKAARAYLNQQKHAPQLEAARRQAAEKWDTQEGAGHFIGRKITGSIASLESAAADVFGAGLGSSYKRLNEGNPTDEDFKNIATYEHYANQDARAGTGKSLAGTALGLAGDIPLFMTGGMVGKAAGAGLGVVGEGLGARAASAALTTAATPHMYVPQIIQKNIAEGKDPYDTSNVAQPIGLAMTQMMVMGEVGRLADRTINPALGLSKEGWQVPLKAPAYAATPGVASALGRTAVQGAVGPVASAASDIVTSAVGLDTGYGTVGDLIKAAQGEEGKAKEAGIKALHQALTFAAFHGSHELMGEYANALRDLKKEGYTFDKAAEIASQALQHGQNAGVQQADQTARSANATGTAGATAAGGQVGEATEPSSTTVPSQPPAAESNGASANAGGVQAGQDVFVDTPGGRLPIEMAKRLYGDSVIPKEGEQNAPPAESGKASPPGEVGPVPTSEPGGPNETTAKDEPGSVLAPETRTVIENKVKSLGSKEAVLDFYDGNTAADVYARSLVGEKEPTPTAPPGENATLPTEPPKAEETPTAKAPEVKSAKRRAKKSGETDASVDASEASGVQDANETVGSRPPQEALDSLEPADRDAFDELAAASYTRDLTDAEQQRLDDLIEKMYSAVKKSLVKQGSLADQAKAAGINPKTGKPYSRETIRKRNKKAGIDTSGDLSPEEQREADANEAALRAKAKVNFFVGPNGAPAKPTPEPALPEPARNSISDDLQKALAPATRGESAGVATGILRENLAELARAKDVAHETLREGAKELDGQLAQAKDPRDVLLPVTDAMESGDFSKLPAKLQTVAQAARKMYDDRVNDLKNLGIVSDFIQNYMGHLWAKPGSTAGPEEIGAMFAKRPLAGKEGFRKGRVIPTYRDGIDMGLEPIDWNPLKLVQLNLAAIDKSIMAHKTMGELELQGLRKYVRIGGDVPEGWRRGSDQSDTKFAPGEVKQKEFFDKQQMEGLENFAASIGVDVQTKNKPYGEALGVESSSGILRRFGTPEEVLAHEIGHAIDRKYGLTDLRHNPEIAKELEGLADLRASGQVSPEYRDYLQMPEEQIANLVGAYLHAPELLAKEAPKSMAAFDAFLKAHPEMTPLRDIKPSLELTSREQTLRLAGPLLAGHYYYPEPVARILDNYTSKSAVAGKTYDAFRNWSNALNSTQLGFGAFHLGFVALDTQISAGALALQKISRGDTKGLAGDIARAVVPGLAPLQTFLKGSKVLSEWLKPGSQGAEIGGIVNSVLQAGGRAKMGMEYKGALENAADAFNAVRKGELSKTGSLLWHAIPAVAEALSKPTMEAAVPRMKLGVFMDMAKHELNRLGTGASLEAKREALGRAWDSVDNRLGQLVYDNLFWQKTVKDISHVLVRSVGWNIGSAREVGGAVTDAFRPSTYKSLAAGEGISPRVAYTIALPALVALNGAMLHYMMNGKAPEDWKDYFMPRTGRMVDGKPERVMLPSYAKEGLHALNRADEGPAAVAKNFGEMAVSKMNPAATLPWHLLMNDDNGYAIRNPNDPIMKQSWDTAKALAGAFEPFSVRKFRQESNDPAKAAANFVGITSPPKALSQSNAEERHNERLRFRKR